ncbi:MAG TPA: GNAT family N-acetyltransferase [Pseudobdellovibrionaceae bacterium]|nr:GNAT family N-acetyltransferase [Pseudobdellovibrionaceae bacterium]
MLEISLVSADEVLSLRQKILRPSFLPEQCRNPEDSHVLSFHLAGKVGGRIVTVASFHPQAHRDLDGGFPYRLRGMATDDSVRGLGYGGRILQKGIGLLREKRCDLLWANARIGAFPFYEKEGFLYSGDLFDIVGIGPHKVMYKHLIPR